MFSNTHTSWLYQPINDLSRSLSQNFHRKEVIFLITDSQFRQLLMSIDDVYSLHNSAAYYLHVLARDSVGVNTVKKREGLKIATQFYLGILGILLKSTVDIRYHQLKYRQRIFIAAWLKLVLSKMFTNFTNDLLRSQENCASSADSSSLKTGKLILLSSILICSLVGNVLIITLVRLREELRRTMNSFIVNMAVSDIIIPILLMPFSLRGIATDSSNFQWPIRGKPGLIFCKLNVFLVAVSITVSVQSLLWMSVDRFMAVVMPLKAHLISSRFRAFAITSTWIVALIINSTDLLTTKLVENDGHLYCIRENITSALLKALGYGRVFLVSIAPFLVITSLYSVIAVKLRSQNKNLRCTAAKENDERKRNAIKMSICIIITYNICVLPYMIFAMTYVSGAKLPCLVYGLFGFFTVLGIYLSSTANPVICFIFVKSYRRGLRGLFSSNPSKKRGIQNTERNRKMYAIDLQIIELKKLRKTKVLP